mgnify:CR=1 FL=1
MANRSKNPRSTNFYRNYRCKVYGRGVNQLVGLPWLMAEFGDILLDKILEKADNTLFFFHAFKNFFCIY